MNEKMLTRLNEKMNRATYCYEQEIDDYEEAIRKIRKCYREFYDMVFQMYLYDLLSTEEWSYLNDSAYRIKDDHVNKLIALSVEREVSNL